MANILILGYTFKDVYNHFHQGKSNKGNLNKNKMSTTKASSPVVSDTTNQIRTFNYYPINLSAQCVSLTQRTKQNISLFVKGRLLKKGCSKIALER